MAKALLLQLARPLLFLVWIVGSLFAVPLALRGLGAPAGVSVALATGCFVGPLAIAAAARGAARRDRPSERKTRVVLAVGSDALVFSAAAYLLMTDQPWAALVVGYTGVLFLGIAIAELRSR
ncbi:MAG: hypothetical protein ACRD2W_08175 [Acidimicrobiales bacterium]